MLETPVLFLVFNRPDTTEQVFSQIRLARPHQLFIAADGPRKGVAGETERCELVRQIATQVDWPCEVKTLFRAENLGCKKAVSGAIDWFFEQVEEGIILEDDCMPEQSFFQFCEKILIHYRYDQRVMMVCGTNYLLDKCQIEESYFFSNYYPIWGWATWKRAWKYYNVEMKGWEYFKVTNQLNWIFSSKVIAKYYYEMFELLTKGFNTWDIQWWFACIFQHGLSIVPKTNLISNKGIIGTHSDTQADYFINAPTSSLDINHLVHPTYVIPDAYLNKMVYQYSHANIDVAKEEMLTNYHAVMSPEKRADSVEIGFLLKSLRKRVVKRLKQVIK